MSPIFWISLIVILNSGSPEEYTLRHERKHTATGRRFPHLFPENVALRLTKISRPLFSWDPPVQAPPPPPISPVNHRNVHSTFKPTTWQTPKESKPIISGNARADAGRALPLSSFGGASVAFRNSYVHKTEPSSDGNPNPVPSRKIFRVVYGNSKREKWKGAAGRSGKRYGAKGRKCNDSGGCFETYAARKNGTRSGGNRSSRVREPAGYRPSQHRRLSKDPTTANRQRFLSGFKTAAKGSRRTCSEMSQKCEHVCVEENGRVACLCYPGFSLVGGTRCVDVDECRANNGGCDGTCINTPGSRRCTCPEGFRLSPVGDRCLDVNECLLRNGHGPCQDKCTNTDGGYFCSCDGIEGTVLAADNHTCEKAKECGPDSGGCSHFCINTFGKAFCTCPDGYELGEDWKTCHDVDECLEGGNCDSECVNTVGSFRCNKSDAGGYDA